MKKAFIFDMDGVIINSEQAWLPYQQKFFTQLFGEQITKRIGNTIGMTVNEVYDKAAQYGFSMKKDRYLEKYDKQAAFIYSKANITVGIDKLAKKLIEKKFKLGLVSSSRTSWIKHVLPRLSFRNKLEKIISINDRSDLQPKPNPDAYLEAIHALQSIPQTTIVLEDSNSGIQAGKAAGAFTIGFRQNLVPGYQQKGANVYAENVDDVIQIAESFLKHD